jgi:hypothetical protein
MGCVKYEMYKIFVFPHLKVWMGGLCNSDNYAGRDIPDLRNSCIPKNGHVTQNHRIVIFVTSQHSFL